MPLYRSRIQRKAVIFLNKELFNTPNWLLDKKLAERARINTYNALFRVQSSILKQLLSKNTLDKMTNDEFLNGTKAIVGASEGESDEDKTLVIIPRSDEELPFGLSIIEIKALT